MDPRPALQKLAKAWMILDQAVDQIIIFFQRNRLQERCVSTDTASRRLCGSVSPTVRRARRG